MSGVQLLINYLIFIFMYNLNIFRHNLCLLGLKIMLQQKKCLKTYLKLIIYVMSRSFGVIFKLFMCSGGLLLLFFSLIELLLLLVLVRNF